MMKPLPLAARRAALFFGAALCLLLVTPLAATARPFAKGAAIGWLQQMAANGYLFYNGQGVQQDCLKFQGVDWVAAAGTSTQSRSCELRDPQALNQLAYYRLRQVDANGPTTYSAVAKRAPGTHELAQVSLYPNPSTGTAPVHRLLQGLAERPVTVRVVDLLGRAVAGQQLIPAGTVEDAIVGVPTATPAGVYLVTVGDGAHV